MPRFLYHVLTARADGTEDPYAPASLSHEGFIHASYAPSVRETTELYFSSEEEIVVLQIDPRQLGVAIDVAITPRGPMPHVRGPIARRAVVARFSRETLPEILPDFIPALPSG